MAPSALYRDVAGVEDLQRLVGNQVYDEVIAAVTTAAIGPTTRTAASSRASSPSGAGSGPSAGGPAGLRLRRHRAGTWGRAAGGPRRLPRAGRVRRVLDGPHRAGPRGGHGPAARVRDAQPPQATHDEAAAQDVGRLPPLPGLHAAGWWVQYVSWAPLIGLVAMGVADQVPPALVATGALCEGAVVSLPEQYVVPVLPRLHELLDAELDRDKGLSGPIGIRAVPIDRLWRRQTLTTSTSSTSARSCRVRQYAPVRRHP